MALQSGFFNSIDDDRARNADFFSRYFASFIGNGVFPNPSNNFQVVANDDMTITVTKGNAWINGTYCFDDFDYTATLDVADGVLNRVDRVVLRLDVIDREIKVLIKKGTFASSPVVPILQRDADAYEIALADVYVGKGAISIIQANITDTRLNTDLCGIVHGVVDQVDTTTLFNQYQSWYTQTTGQANLDIDTMLNQFMSDFNTWYTTNTNQWSNDFTIWFDSIKGQLEGDIAANLASQVTDLQNTKADKTSLTLVENNLGSHLAESAAQAHLAKNIGLEDTTGNFVATEVEGAMNELFTNVSDGKSLVGGAITGVDDSVVIPTEPTFQDLANAVGQIGTGKKWSGGTIATYVSNGNTKHVNIPLSNLSFVPKYICAQGRTGSTVHGANIHFNGYNNYGDGKVIRMVRILNGNINIVVEGVLSYATDYTIDWIAFE